MTSTEAAALRDLVLRTSAAVPAIDALRLAKVYVAIRTDSPREGSSLGILSGSEPGDSTTDYRHGGRVRQTSHSRAQGETGDRLNA